MKDPKVILKIFFEKSQGRVLVLTGAGISTDSGIPDYRGPRGIYVRNKDYKPITYQQFMSSHSFRQRYWARSFLGWPKIAHALPNNSHLALTSLQQQSIISSIITQNVDGLHSKAGSRNVSELHGTLHQVECTSQGCGTVVERTIFQEDLARMNQVVAQWAEAYPGRIAGDVSSSVNPDGDVEITWDYSDFQIPSCPSCSGVMKPKVVFFGENLTDKMRQESLQHVDEANALLVIGSSLKVFSAYRLVLRAHEQKKPIGILNLGETRADQLASFRIEKSSIDMLPGLF